MNELKKFKYEKEYYIEKNKVLKNIQKQYKNLMAQKENLIKHNLDTLQIDKRLEQIIVHQQVEQKILLDLFQRKQIVERKINSLEQPYKNVLYFKYICNYTFEEVAEKMHYSIKRIYQLHKIGVDMFNLLK